MHQAIQEKVFLQNWRRTFFLLIFAVLQKLTSYPYGFYVGVAAGGRNIVTNLIGLTLAWLTGDIVDVGNHTCTDQHSDYVKQLNLQKKLFFKLIFYSCTVILKCRAVWRI